MQQLNRPHRLKVRSGWTLILLLAGLLQTTTQAQTQAPLLSFQTGHLETIQALAFSKDGNYLASAGDDNLIKIWDFKTGVEIKTLQGHKAGIRKIQFYNHGNGLISCDKGGSLFVWDLISGSIRQEIQESITDFTLNTNEQTVALVNRNLILAKWVNGNLQLAKMDDDLTRQIGYEFISSIAFSPRKPELLVGTSRGIFGFNLTTNSIRSIVRRKSITKLLYDTGSDDILAIFGKSRIFFPLVAKIGRFHSNGRQKYVRGGNYIHDSFTDLSINANGTLVAAGSTDRTTTIWHAHTGRPYTSLMGSYKAIRAVCFHPLHPDTLVTAGADHQILVWNVREKKLLYELKGALSPITSMAVNASGTQISIALSNNQIRQFDLRSGIRMNSFSGHKANISGLQATGLQDSVASVSYDNTVRYWNTRSGKPLKRFSGSLLGSATPLWNNILIAGILVGPPSLYLYAKKFIVQNKEHLLTSAQSTDGQVLATAGSGVEGGFNNGLFPRRFSIQVFDNMTQKRQKRIRGAHTGSVLALAFNKDHNLLASSGSDAYVNIWSTQNRKLLYAFKHEEKYSTSIVRSLAFGEQTDSLLYNDGRRITLFDFKRNQAREVGSGIPPLRFYKQDTQFFSQEENAIKLWNITNQSIEKTFSGHTDQISTIDLIKPTNRLVTGSWDGTVKLWDIKSGLEIATFYTVDERNFVVRTPDNYFYATKPAARRFGYTIGLKTYPFEQFDLRFNRPDIVLKRLGYADSSYINALQKAYYRRLKRMNFTENMLTGALVVPTIALRGKNPPYSTSEPNLTIHVETDGKQELLDRLVIVVNDVPLYGSSGLGLKNLNRQQHAQAITIPLSEGRNRIQLSVLNQRGVESLKETVETVYTPLKSQVRKPNLYMVIIGVSTYANAKYNLQYADTDAKQILDLFSQKRDKYGSIIPKIFLNKSALADSILAIRKMLMQTHVDDEILLFYAGHGLLDADLNYYLATYDTDFTSPAGKALPYEKIEGLLDGTPSRRKIILMDACHAGEIDKEDTLNYPTESKDSRGVIVSAVAGKQPKSGISTTELMKDLFTDLKTGSGATVIAAAGGAQYAYESDELKKGVFTYCLVNGIRSRKADLDGDGKILLSELLLYIQDQVPAMTKGRQKPTSRLENIYNNIEIW